MLLIPKVVLSLPLAKAVVVVDKAVGAPAVAVALDVVAVAMVVQTLMRRGSFLKKKMTR